MKVNFRAIDLKGADLIKAHFYRPELVEDDLRGRNERNQFYGIGS